MRELFGRLIELDPAASEDVKVIDYFDRLTAARVDAETLLREAALLARATVGYQTGERTLRFLTSGAPAGATQLPTDAPTVAIGDHGHVWMDIRATSAPSASMILDRLALALLLTATSEIAPQERSAVEILLTAPLPDESPADRLAAMGRLRLEPNGQFHALALPLTETPPAWPNTVIDTEHGPVRGVIARAGFDWIRAGGVGTPAEGHLLHTSWRHALIALRLSDGSTPFDATTLGPLLIALDSPETTSLRRAEVERLRGALNQHWTLAELQAVADGRSLRQIAAQSGLHHSTVQTRLTHLPTALGYDPTTPMGRHRLALSILLFQLSLRTATDRPLL